MNRKKLAHQLMGAMLITLLLVGCGTPAVRPTSVSPTVTPTPLPPTATPTPASVVPTIPSTTQAIGWTIYTLPDGISIEYPSGWTAVSSNHGASFHSPNDEHSIRVEVYNRPRKERAITDPHSWEGNEGGYKVHWEKKISIESAEGLEFVWGAVLDNQWDTAPSLEAVYYSEQYELDIRLSTAFDIPYLELMQSSDPAGAISARFGIFEHMVQSIRINR